MQGFVAELGPSAKEVLVASNDGFEAQLDMEVLGLVFWVSEADAVFAILLLDHVRASWNDIDLFVNFIKLLEDKLLGLEEARLKGLEDLDHELWVLRVGPLIEIRFSVCICPLRIFLLHLKVYLEHV